MHGFGNKGLVEVKKLFFDRAGMDKRADRMRLQFLSKAGAFVMTTARQSIRTGKKKSQPGKPPTGHGKKLLKRNIFFGLDKQNDQTLVGPINLNQPALAVTPANGTVPSVLEHSGPILIKEVFKKGRWRPYRTGDEGLPIRIRRGVMLARPFMGPALEKNAPKFPAMMQGQFK